MKWVKLAEEQGIKLRQNYNRTMKYALCKLGGYLHAKQMKRAKKVQKNLKTLVGRVIRDCERKSAGNEKLRNLFEDLLLKAKHLVSQKAQDKNKLYSV